jgi:hypothetical protein
MAADGWLQLAAVCWLAGWLAALDCWLAVETLCLKKNDVKLYLVLGGCRLLPSGCWLLLSTTGRLAS